MSTNARTAPAVDIVHLTRAGTSLVIGISDAAAQILHFGAALSTADADALARTSTGSVTFSSFDAPRVLPILPVESAGWSGSPALAWHRDGRHSAPQPVLAAVEHPAEHSARLIFTDDAAGVRVAAEFDLDDGGTLAASLEITSTTIDGPPLDLIAARVVMPLPDRAQEILDHTGRWTKERAPQRTRVRDGGHVRASRRGRDGHDAAYVTLVGTDGFGFRSGEIWSAHIAWSGNTEVAVERLPEGAGVHSATLIAGELLLAGEIRLSAGEAYRSPTIYLAHSLAGIDGVTERYHRTARALPGHPDSSRPLVLNTWEAVYFEQSPLRIFELADAAAEVGVERFVLDDGWFRHRPDDRSGLGDWYVDTDKWPDGLRPLADHVHGLGMQFGLWFEPEMVSPDSDLARAHPEWILSAMDRPSTWRHQLVLDLTQHDAWEHLRERITASVRDFGIDFIKWDHNRDLHAAVSPGSGRAGVHAQTAAFYALVDAVREEHPELEIESCASGGARMDLGVLARTQRVWASDSNDPIERQEIQRHTATLLPPEVVGSHVGPEIAETTHRAAALEFRLKTALFGHAGIEWDLTSCTPAERTALRSWSALYRELRPLLHAGTTVRADGVDPQAHLHGIVSAEKDHAVFAWVRTGTSVTHNTPRTRVPGLGPDTLYRLRERTELGRSRRHEVSDPHWLHDEEAVFSGRFLAAVGVPLPLLAPGSAMLLEVRSAD